MLCQIFGKVIIIAKLNQIKLNIVINIMNNIVKKIDESRYVIHWFRRDLRLEDNVALHFALKSGLIVIPLFIFDTDILNKLSDKKDARVSFIYQQLNKINQELVKLHHSGLMILKGKPIDIFEQLLTKYNIDAVYTNNDYEPSAISRDNDIEKFLKHNGVKFNSYKDQVIFEKDEIIKADGNPYTIFTPYKNKWLEKFSVNNLQNYSTSTFKDLFLKIERPNIPSLKDIGFEENTIDFPKIIEDIDIIKAYKATRDYPSIDTTRIGIHLRFGTVSIRKIVNLAFNNSDVWLSELIWREFFMQILYHFPYVENSSFKTKYNNIEWRNNEIEFDLWCHGKTGYPLVDAGMRELNATGFMHNRVRMVTASFLCKHLLIDWRWGEAYFAEKLLDYELASNNGNWQWAAGTGCDAAPYFRIFNPTIQLSNFDKENIYVRKWLTDMDSKEYLPIVEHRFATERCLKAYKKALE